MTVSEACSHSHRCRIGEGTRPVEAREIGLQPGTRQMMQARLNGSSTQSFPEVPYQEEFAARSLPESGV